MDLVIYGAGNIGKYISEYVEKYYSNSYRILGFLDSSVKGKCNGKTIFDIDCVNKDTTIVISVSNYYSVVDIYYLLMKKGFKNVYWYTKSLNCKQNDNDFLSEHCINTSNWGDCVMPIVEIHISDKCNLNCKGCTHFSPLYDSVNVKYENVMSDLMSLKNIFSNIMRIDILGGEPLVSDNLGKYVVEMRKLFPNTSLELFTNGLLIPSLSDEVCKILRENNVLVTVTEYEPTHRIIDKIINKLEEYNIRYSLVPYDIRQAFNKPISLSDNSKYPKLCISDGCVVVAEGKIARCPTLMYIDKFNEYFGTNLPNDGILKLCQYKDGKELLDELKKEVPLCKHCIKCDMKWDKCTGDKKLSDFAVID